MRWTTEVMKRTARELLEGFGIPFERAVLEACAAGIMDDYSLAIQRGLQSVDASDPRRWLAFCRDSLRRTDARHAAAARHVGAGGAALVE